MTGFRLLAALAVVGVLGLVALLVSTGRTGDGPGGERPLPAGQSAPSDPAGGAGAGASGAAPTPDLAERTLDRFERFRSGTAGNRLALGGPELSAVARYALAGLFPPGVLEPTVRLDDGRIAAAARVVTGDFPTLPRMAGLRALLPDTVRVEIRGWLEPFDEHRLALAVERVSVGGVPLPSAAVPEVLAALGREAHEGLAEDALAVPRPRGLLAVVVQRDSLVLVGDGAGRAGAVVADESG